MARVKHDLPSWGICWWSPKTSMRMILVDDQSHSKSLPNSGEYRRFGYPSKAAMAVGIITWTHFHSKGNSMSYENRTVPAGLISAGDVLVSEYHWWCWQYGLHKILSEDIIFINCVNRREKIVARAYSRRFILKRAVFSVRLINKQ